MKIVISVPFLFRLLSGGNADPHRNEKSLINSALRGSTSNTKTIHFIDSPAVSADENRVIVPMNSQKLPGKEVQMEDGLMIGQRERVLSPLSSETRSVVAVHVTALDKTTTSSPEQLRDVMFYDDLNLLTQFYSCSYGMTKMEPFDGDTEVGKNIDRGVAEVTIDMTVTGKTYGGVQRAIMTEFDKNFGSTDQFDHILLCMPPGTMPGIAIASPGEKVAAIRDDLCDSVSLQMWSIGFQLGLTTTNGVSIGAQGPCGYMGNDNHVDDPVKCYNPPNSWYLGWYQDHRIELDFTSADVTKPVTTTLVGINDYEKATANKEYVIVKVYNPDGDDVYIGFNRADGINADTDEARDQVTVHTKQRNSRARSNFIFKGDSGSYSYNNFGGSGQSLVIQVNGIDTSWSVWKASVTIYLSNCSPSDCPTSSPTSHPSSYPSLSPSSHPSSVPSKGPSPHPSQFPSSTPSSMPSNFGCTDHDPCEGGDDEFRMCMYDFSKDEVKDKCQTVEKLEKQLAKGDEFIKCGACYGDFNVYSRADSNDCPERVPSCGEKDGENKYPMCIWDESKQEPKSKCELTSKLDELTQNGDILLDCGFCDELNLFEEYNWNPPTDL